MFKPPSDIAVVTAGFNKQASHSWYGISSAQKTGLISSCQWTETFYASRDSVASFRVAVHLLNQLRISVWDSPSPGRMETLNRFLQDVFFIRRNAVAFGDDEKQQNFYPSGDSHGDFSGHSRESTNRDGNEDSETAVTNVWAPFDIYLSFYSSNAGLLDVGQGGRERPTPSLTVCYFVLNYHSACE